MADREGATTGSRFLSLERGNLVSFRRRDHGPRDGSALRPWVEAQLATHGIVCPARITLYCFPRILGYVFNPLALYLCYDRANTLLAAVYEVRNTDGDLCPYTVALQPHGAVPQRHRFEKSFYVSPFISGEQSYRFVLDAPCDLEQGLSLRIRVDGPEGLTLIATEHADPPVPVNDGALLRAFVAIPLMTWKVIGGIYFEALRLRLKGAAFFRHPGGDGRYVRFRDKTISEHGTDTP